MTEIEQHYTVDQISEKLAVTPRVVRELLKSGRLKGKKIGRSWRVAESDLKNFIFVIGFNERPTPPDLRDLPDVGDYVFRKNEEEENDNKMEE